MNEFRYDIIDDNWVCIAAGRADRPHSFDGFKISGSVPEYDPDCPFCPGNEKMMPPIIQERSAGQSFVTRVIPNKYPIVKSENKFEKNEQTYFELMSGFGHHEVLIESPIHNRNLSSMSANEIEDVLRMYLQRYRVISSKQDVKSVFLFKNNGPEAGTSLQHPHAQLVGLPFVPVKISQQERYFQEYFRKDSKCLICENLEKETYEAVRIIKESEHFVSLVPYAAANPFEQLIIPKRHMVEIINMEQQEIIGLAELLYLATRALNNLQPDVSYNLLFTTYSLPVDCNSQYLHWYLSIIPRINTMAGFEFGSGMKVNSSIPEQDAEILRKEYQRLS